MHLHSCIVLKLLSLLAGAYGARLGIISAVGKEGVSEAFTFPRPSYEERAIMARWLVHETSWGVLSTLDRHRGEPVGGVVSHSDGPRNIPTGRVFFYITPMDELTQNVMLQSRQMLLLRFMEPNGEHATALLQSLLKADPRCSFTISEQELRGSAVDGSVAAVGGQSCGGLDPEDPACARATLLGRLEEVAEGDLQEAQTAMFSRHPRMADWPLDHDFRFFELLVEEVHLLDWYGGMAVISGEEYYTAAVADTTT